jgi:transposase InsO family protein
MLEFLWPGASKSGQPMPEAAAGAAKQERSSDGTENDQAKVPDTGTRALPLARPGGARAVDDESNREEAVKSSSEVADPLSPPGGSAEFTDDPANVPDEIEAAPGARQPHEELATGSAPASDPASNRAVDAAVGRRPLLAGRRPGRRLVKPQTKAPALTAPQRLLLLDTWRRSQLPAGDFAALVGLSRHTLYAWKKKFDEQGPAGLLEQPRGGPKGSRLPELTKRTILMLKAANPEWGCQRISDLLGRGPALPASPGAVAKVLHEAGYELAEVSTRPHPDKVRHFERAKPNQLWQTDLFTFILKRQNRRVYLVAFMDDHSRFIVGYGLHASQSSALVLEVLRAGITSSGTPEEILTDNGSQYVTWRGKSAFSKELEKRGIKQVVAAPRRPQTLGKIERFWGTLWRECVASAIFVDLGDAQRRMGWFIDHYNFARTHSGIEGLTPADRFFGAASEVKKTLQARVAANALELARQGTPKTPFYLTGQMGRIAADATGVASGAAPRGDGPEHAAPLAKDQGVAKKKSRVLRQGPVTWPRRRSPSCRHRWRHGLPTRPWPKERRESRGLPKSI